MFPKKRSLQIRCSIRENPWLSRFYLLESMARRFCYLSKSVAEPQ